MTLEIVWRNPMPMQKPTSSIQRVAHSEQLAIYLVSTEETTGEFELFVGGAA